ncbi:MAG TPA: sensor histidine kinase [Streptosporangiaceae bacterium]|jgi:signal transduction histidine kinase
MSHDRVRERFGHLPAAALDALLAVAAAATVLVGVALAPPGRTALDPVGYLLPLAGAVALAARRRRPVTVLCIAVACQLAYELRGYPGVIPAFPVLIALYTAVESGRRLPAIAVVSVAFGCGLTIDLVSIHDQPVRETLQDRFLLAGWIVAAAVLAEVSRHRHAYLRQVEQRAAEAERTREEAALRRAGQERLRIARELHDSLTHSISIIKVQAGVAVHLARKKGEQVPEALLAIQEAGGEAMRELRATLEVLRTDHDDANGGADGTGLDRLPDLVERARTAGLPATVTVSGERRSLPADVDRAAYRIVQEALTNIARHAGPASAQVQIDYGPDELTIQVDDDGCATLDQVPRPGVGLTGMRERVTALGGHLEARPRPEGGFTVRAELPLPGPMQTGVRAAVQGLS